MSQFFDINSRPDPDELIIKIADYVMDYEIQSDEAYETAKSCLIAVSYTHLTLPTSPHV